MVFLFTDVTHQNCIRNGENSQCPEIGSTQMEVERNPSLAEIAEAVNDEIRFSLVSLSHEQVGKKDRDLREGKE